MRFHTVPDVEIIHPGRALVKPIEITFTASLYDMIDALIQNSFSEYCLYEKTPQPGMVWTPGQDGLPVSKLDQEPGLAS